MEIVAMDMKVIINIIIFFINNHTVSLRLPLILYYMYELCAIVLKVKL